MNTLENIVLPLAESRALVGAGIVLDTALVWQRSLAHINHPVSVHIKGDNSGLGIEDFFEDICPAPTLSELLDAIRAKVAKRTDETAITLMRDGKDAGASCMGIRVEGIRKYNAAPAAPTDLLAAAALLMEVSR